MKVSYQNIFTVRNRPVSCDFSLELGKVHGLIGANGVGKSSFFHFLKGNAKSIFDDKKFVFMDQFPLRPLGEIRVKDVFSILAEDTPYFCDKKFGMLVDRFHFQKFEDDHVWTLSGGENQILKFIMAMAMDVDVYCLDEPLQYLDGDNLLEINKVISDYKKEEKTFLVIEHRRELIQSVVDFWLGMSVEEKQISIEASHGI